MIISLYCKNGDKMGENPSGESPDTKVESAKETESMNEELKQWIKEAEQDIGITEKVEGSREEEAKKPEGKCEVCGEKNARSVCIKCGKSICASCYFKLIGVCKKCVPKDVVDKWDAKHPDWEEVLGVEWVD
jgi:hypothetical protein